MSKNQPVVPDTAVAANPVPATFRDSEWKSRTLILPDGRAVLVADYCVTTADPVEIEYLSQHPDFSRV